MSEEQEKPRFPQRWPAGYCPNPKGRPKGSRNKVKPVRVNKKIDLEVQRLLETGDSAEKMVENNSRELMARAIATAKHDPDPKRREKMLNPLLDRIIAPKKDQGLGEFRRVHELTDRELIQLGMALQKKQEKAQPLPEPQAIQAEVKTIGLVCAGDGGSESEVFNNEKGA